MSGSLDLCGSPRCTAPTTSGIHVAGGSSVLQLPASAGCQHAVPSLGEIRTILSGCARRKHVDAEHAEE